MTRRRAGEPDGLEVALLRVCFLPLDEAGAVWDHELAPMLVIDALPVELHGLLPLLHRRLVELERRPADMDRLQGVRRRLWVQNELRLRSVHTAVGQLDASGTPATLLGGLAILVGHLGRSDLRPLHDADLLVRASDAADALATLRAGGWRVEAPWRGGYLLDVGGARCTDSQGQSVSLRWSEWPPYADAIDHASPAGLDEPPVKVVSEADLLLHTVLDGPRTRWASDALVVLLGGTDLDWARLAAAAAARRGTAALSHALGVLDRVVPLSLPPDAPALTSRGSAQLRFGRHPAQRPTVLRAYARRTAGARPGPALRGGPAYLCEVWDVATPARLPREVARRLRRRLARHP